MAENAAGKGSRINTGMKIVKVMSVFTGVEGLGIICSAVRNKLVALWLDAVGIGLFSIFNSTIETTTYLTGLGLRQSAVRDISLAAGESEGKLRRVIRRVRSWSVVAGLLGCAVLTAFAWPLAEIIFHDGGMWWNFLLLAGALLFNALYAGEAAVFQGTENFRRMARVGAWSAFIGLIVSIPMYRFMGNASVAFSILAYSVSALLVAFIYRDRRFSSERPSRAMLREEKEFVKLGAWLSITAFINSGCQLIFSGWLNAEVSTAEVGFYAAGYTLVVRYTSLVFNSVGLEFYPRISANIKHPLRMDVFLNHEVTLLLLIFTPLVMLFLIFREVIVLLFYTPEFLAAVPFITFGIVVVILRAVSNTEAFIIMAKGEGKIYLLTESLDALMGLGLSVWLYSEMGLLGLGVALIIWHFVYMLVVSEICRRRYGLTLARGAGRRACESLVLTFGVIGATYWLPKYVWIPAAAVICAVYLYNFYIF